MDKYEPEIIDSGNLTISLREDIIKVRKLIRDRCKEYKFSTTDTARIVAAASELSWNIYNFVGLGIMIWQIVNRNNKIGIRMIFRDNGHGIRDLEKAMRFGYSSWKGYGIGLPGVKVLMDSFDIESNPGSGTIVTVCKWRTD